LLDNFVFLYSTVKNRVFVLASGIKCYKMYTSGKKWHRRKNMKIYLEKYHVICGNLSYELEILLSDLKVRELVRVPIVNNELPAKANNRQKGEEEACS